MTAERRRARWVGLGVLVLLGGAYLAAWFSPDPLERVPLPAPSRATQQTATGGSRLLRWRSVSYEVADTADAARAEMVRRLAENGWQAQGDAWTRAGIQVRLRADPVDASHCRVVLLITRG